MTRWRSVWYRESWAARSQIIGIMMRNIGYRGLSAPGRLALIRALAGTN